MTFYYLSNEEKKSIYEKTARLADCFDRIIPGVPLSTENKKAIDDFYGANGEGPSNSINSYYELAMDDEISVDEGDEELSRFLDNMTKVIGYSTYVQYDPVFFEYHDTFEHFCQKAFSGFLFVLGYINPFCSSERNMSYIQKMAHIWTGSKDSIKNLKAFKGFEEKMNKSGKHFDNEVYYNYFLHFMENSFSGEIVEDKNAAEYHIESLEYWKNYVVGKLESGDIQSVWKDDVVNLYFQMVNMPGNLFDESSHLSGTKSIFLSQANLAPDSDRVKGAIETMDSIIEEYKDKELDDESKIQKYIDAFKTVYLQEYLSGTLQAPQSTSSKYAKFVIMQFEALKKYGEKKSTENQEQESEEDRKAREFAYAFNKVLKQKQSAKNLPSANSSSSEYAEFANQIADELRNLDMSEKPDTKKTNEFERLFYRAYSTFIIKESAQKIRDKWADDKDTDVIVARNSAISQYSPIVGSAKEAGKVNSIRYSPIHPTYFGNRLQFLEVAGHEMTHLVNGGVDVQIKHMDYDSYMESKTKIIMEGNNRYSQNYYSTYHEIRAGIGGDIAIIEALKEFPIGDKSSLEEIINKKKQSITSDYSNCFKSKLYDNENKCENLVKICDEYFNNGLSIIEKNDKYKALKDMLLLEYNEDGTPKTFGQILQDQEKEMETKVMPPVGPQDMLGRIKFRMRMMMQRAIAQEKEDELVDSLNLFISAHSDELYQFEFFKSVFPNGAVPSESEAKDIFDGLFAAEVIDYEKSEFVHSLYEVEKSRNKNKSPQIANSELAFGKTVIPYLASKSQNHIHGTNSPNGPNSHSGGYDDQIP